MHIIGQFAEYCSHWLFTLSIILIDKLMFFYILIFISVKLFSSLVSVLFFSPYFLLSHWNGCGFRWHVLVWQVEIYISVFYLFLYMFALSNHSASQIHTLQLVRMWNIMLCLTIIKMLQIFFDFVIVNICTYGWC